MVISNLSAVKLNEKPPAGELTFTVDAKLEEREHRSGQVKIAFALNFGTKPSVVKFGVEGIAILSGKEADIEKMMEMDPETRIPRVLYGVYQQVFTSLFLVSTVMSSPYPPANLFNASKQAPPNVEMSTALATKDNLETAQTTTESANVEKESEQ